MLRNQKKLYKKKKIRWKFKVFKMVQMNFYSHRYEKKMYKKKGGEAFLSLKLFTDVLIFRAASMVQWLIDNEIDPH